MFQYKCYKVKKKTYNLTRHTATRHNLKLKFFSFLVYSDLTKYFERERIFV